MPDILIRKNRRSILNHHADSTAAGDSMTGASQTGNDIESSGKYAARVLSNQALANILFMHYFSLNTPVVSCDR
jgi:hypothetical protein